MAEKYKRYAVITGANKGIGFGIVQQLASHGITVILTARNEQRGLKAVEQLKQLNPKGDIIFHQLDVADQDSVNHFSDFIKTKFGKLDILVNNAGVGSGKPVEHFDVHKFKDTLYSNFANPSRRIAWEEFFIENSETTIECFNINYYGTKRMCEAMIPFLKMSDDPRIVNVSSSSGLLKNITNEWAKSALGDIENLSEEKIDEVLKKCIKSVEIGALNWSVNMNGYTLSKASVNAYTRLLSEKYPFICSNAVCPGYVNTDFSFNLGVLSVEEGADSIISLALAPNHFPSGKFFFRKEEASF